MQYINTLREGDDITETYLCKSKSSGVAKNGKTFYSLVLQDKTGTIDGKIWELSNAIEHFEAMEYVKLSAKVTSFNNKLQLNIRQTRRAEEGTYEISDYMPMTKFNIDEMFKELLALIDSIKDEKLKTLLKSFFVEDASFAKAFKMSSAAKSMHHAFVGGLLQHTLSVARIADFLAGFYPIMNRDLLVTAAICHDIGKVKEISEFPVNDYTDAGNLLGHIVMGAMMVKEKADGIAGFDETLKNNLVHCILAHHGKLEYGSPEKPKIIEAVALSFADDTDAKLEGFSEALESEQAEGDWLPYNKMFESIIRKTN